MLGMPLHRARSVTIPHPSRRMVGTHRTYGVKGACAPEGRTGSAGEGPDGRHARAAGEVWVVQDFLSGQVVSRRPHRR